MAKNRTTVFEIHDLAKANDGRDLIILLMELGAIPKIGQILCPNQLCKKPLNLGKSGSGKWKWICRKQYANAKKGKQICQNSFSIRTGTFFSKSHLPIDQICKFVAFWCSNLNLKQINDQLEISPKTLVDWANFCREVVFDAFIRQSTPIGGTGKTVEIDESKFGKRKYNRGHHVDGQWVFGMIERESGTVILVPVEKRDTATLLPLIKKWILPNTTIISDCWKAYDCLSEEDYIHLKVNHSLNFVDRETGAHTNKIEATWRAAKRCYESSSRRKMFYGGYLAKYMFIKSCNIKQEDPFKIFMRHAGILYPGNLSETPDENENVNINVNENEDEEIDDEFDFE